MARSIEWPEDLEYQGGFVAAAVRCRDLGWRLAAVDARELMDLAVNFSEPVDLWLRQCSRAGPLQGRVNLGVHTGSASGLLVLEVKSGEGTSALDRCGSWRSPCRARLNGREQHFYALPAGGFTPHPIFAGRPAHGVWGGGSGSPAALHGCPDPGMLALADPALGKPAGRGAPCPVGLFAAAPPTGGEAGNAEIPSWEDIYHRITPHEALLKALLAPCRSLEDYYGNLLREALDAGFPGPGISPGSPLARPPRGCGTQCRAPGANCGGW
jgi:hypothetical protein